MKSSYNAALVACASIAIPDGRFGDRRNAPLIWEKVCVSMLV